MLTKIEAVKMLTVLQDGQHIDSFDLRDDGPNAVGGRFVGVINKNAKVASKVTDNNIAKVASELALKGLRMALGRGVTEVVLVKGDGLYTNDPELKVVQVKPIDGSPDFSAQAIEAKPSRDLPYEAKPVVRTVLDAA